MSLSPQALLQAVRAVAQRHPGLRLMVLFGSRARGDAGERSDWDLGYLADEVLDVDGLLADVVQTIDTDKVDLVDLQRASGLLRFRAARDGIAIFEARDRQFETFQIEAARYWCDMEPILRREYEHLLAQIPS